MDLLFELFLQIHATTVQLKYLQLLKTQQKHKEIKIANDFNFKSITLSSKRLRTETAAIVACYQLTHKK